MKNRRAAWVALVLLFASPGVGLAGESDDQFQASGKRLVEQFETRVRPVLEGYCIDCHNAHYGEGGVKLDRLDPDMLHGNDAERWHAALDAVNSGDMPPEDGDQPSDQDRQLIVDWATESIALARDAREDTTQPRLRRLTKKQYANTMEDLLGLSIDFSVNLPSDSPSEMGFLNNAATQQTSSLHLEYYESAAREALSKAIVVGERPAPTRYRLRLGKGFGGGQALEITGYHAKAIPREHLLIDFLDGAGEPIEPSDPEERSRLDALRRGIGIDMRGSRSDRYGVTEAGLVLYSALPHVEVSPYSWQGPSPNLQVLFRRCLPDSGPFAFRVSARPAPFASVASRSLVSLRSNQPLVALDMDSQPVVGEGALVLEACNFGIIRNLVLEDEELLSLDVTRPSAAVVSFQIEREGLYQLDLVHPTEVDVAMPSIALEVDGATEHIQLTGQNDAGSRGRAVTPLMYAQFAAGENSITIRNKFFGGLSHLVATPLPADHPTAVSLADAQRRNLARFKGIQPYIRVFAGTRTDDGMEYKTFGESTPVSPSSDQACVYEFHDYLENLPLPERGRDQMDALSGIAILGLWNDRLVSSRSDHGPPVLIESLEIETPYHPQWPPAHHTAILFEDAERLTDLRSYTRRVLERFVSRAFRRPATGGEVARYLGYWESIRGDFATYEEGIRETLVPVLCSPSFLYLDAAAAAGQEEASYALASRLAYFLWNSPPDEQLLGLAESGELEGKLPITVARMLAHPKAERFVRTFVAEWLRLDRHESVSVNARRFPSYNRFVKRDMHDETVSFVQQVIKKNLSARTLIDSEFVMLNQNLADYYGVAGVEGNRFRPVTVVPELGRGGLLTQGAFLTGHSDGTHSHPIKRAVWLKERILGDPPPPPPPNVPELDPETPGFDKLTLKEQLEVHRSKASCVSCHRQIDPYGVLFEGYDAVGRTRTKAGGKPVDARSQLPDGLRLNGVVELKRHLLEEAYEDVLSSLCEHLFAYATGLNINYANRPEVDRLVEQAKRDDRLVSMIVAVIRAESFLGEPRREPTAGAAQ